MMTFAANYDILRISSLPPYSVTDGNCLNDCKGATICNDEIDEYYRPKPTVFDETIYGAECALELEKKREELETSGLLDRILQEVALTDCLYNRGYMYVFIAQQIYFQ